MASVFTFVAELTAVNDARALLVYKAGETNAARVLRCSATAKGDNQELECSLTRITADGSGALGASYLPHESGSDITPLGDAYSGYSSDPSWDEGSFGQEVFQSQGGWFQQVGDDEKIWVPPNGLIGIRLHGGPGTSADMVVSMTLEEIQF